MRCCTHSHSVYVPLHSAEANARHGNSCVTSAYAMHVVRIDHQHSLSIICTPVLPALCARLLYRCALHTSSSLCLRSACQSFCAHVCKCARLALPAVVLQNSKFAFFVVQPLPSCEGSAYLSVRRRPYVFMRHLCHCQTAATNKTDVMLHRYVTLRTSLHCTLQGWMWNTMQACAQEAPSTVQHTVCPQQQTTHTLQAPPIRRRQG